jgi:hypothetical protein
VSGDGGAGGTFALYSLICRYAKINLATNQAPEDRDLSTYRLELPSGTAKRAARIKEFLERNRFMKHLLLTVALVGTCCVIGDGVLTPSISGTYICRPCFSSCICSSAGLFLQTRRRFAAAVFSASKNRTCRRVLPCTVLSAVSGIKVNTPSLSQGWLLQPHACKT